MIRAHSMFEQMIRCVEVVIQDGSEREFEYTIGGVSFVNNPEFEEITKFHTAPVFFKSLDGSSYKK
jgi:hypothetical protein